MAVFIGGDTKKTKFSVESAQKLLAKVVLVNLLELNLMIYLIQALYRLLHILLILTKGYLEKQLALIKKNYLNLFICTLRILITTKPQSTN